MQLNFREDIQHSTMFDFLTFINMFTIKGATRRNIKLYFNDVKDCWITKEMDTIWVLSYEQAKKECCIDVIGWDDMASYSFFKELFEGLIKANPRFEYLLNLIRG